MIAWQPASFGASWEQTVLQQLDMHGDCIPELICSWKAEPSRKLPSDLRLFFNVWRITIKLQIGICTDCRWEIRTSGIKQTRWFYELKSGEILRFQPKYSSKSHPKSDSWLRWWYFVNGELRSSSWWYLGWISASTQISRSNLLTKLQPIEARTVNASKLGAGLWDQVRPWSSDIESWDEDWERT